MKLITTEAQLRAHIPNIIATVKGETPFIERLAHFLDLAEDWVKTTFTSECTFNTICGYTDSNNIKILCSRLVVADALRRAIPSFDIVLTPNGFGVVSTQNLAPASKSRVDRLVGSMLSHRDDCIAALLPELVGASKWLSSSQADFFGATLFPDLGIVDAVGEATGSMWEKYLELRSQVIDLEASLAEEWLSPELMSALRSENLRGDLTPKRREVVRQVKAQIVGYLTAGTFSTRRLADIVNYIRQDEDEFPDWHHSATAELFSPPVFRNKKKSTGYFF
ncbi:putative uncharacterized protein [Firmicutes bacterium CAG:882]|jgi:hypothetical protein|nr:putative uncharacterized protein [Firmicutes bacterium CAG:882]